MNQIGQGELAVPERLADAVFDDPAFHINRLSGWWRQLDAGRILEHGFHLVTVSQLIAMESTQASLPHRHTSPPAHEAPVRNEIPGYKSPLALDMRRRSRERPRARRW